MPRKPKSKNLILNLKFDPSELTREEFKEFANKNYRAMSEQARHVIKSAYENWKITNLRPPSPPGFSDTELR